MITTEATTQLFLDDSLSGGCMPEALPAHYDWSTIIARTEAE
jgi:hypothetical protein